MQEQPMAAVSYTHLDVYKRQDLVRAEQDFCQGKFQDFSDEELHQYRVLEEKIKRNILRVLH